MPVRIYDISKKLGLENKEILAIAKSLGIVAAKVPSSSLDKITAEYLEGEIRKAHPEINTAPPAPAPVPIDQTPVVVVTASPTAPPVLEILPTPPVVVVEVPPVAPPPAASPLVVAEVSAPKPQPPPLA